MNRHNVRNHRRAAIAHLQWRCACLVLAIPIGIGIFVTAPAAHAQEEDSVTLAEAWHRVRSANPAMAAAQVDVERRTEEHRATASLYGPQVDIAARYTVIDDPIVLDLDPIRSAILALHPSVSSELVPSFVEEVQDDQFLRAELTAVWPVYTGGRIRAARRAAGAAVDEAEAEARRTGDTLLSELVRRFYAAQLARVVHATRVLVLEGLDEHLRQARRLEDEGFIAHAEVLHAQVAYDTAWRDERRAQRQVEIAEVALGGLLAETNPVTPASPLFLVTRPLEGVETFLASAEENHPALAVIAARRAQASAGVAVERGGFLPEVFLFGSRELNSDGLTVLDPEWSAGVGMRLALWDRSNRRRRLEAARLLEQRVDFIADEVRLGLRTLVEKSHREVAQAQEQFASLDSSLGMARENLRVREAAFREGQATSLDVVDARLSLAGVETERAAAAHEFAVALAALLETSGQPERFFAYEAEAMERISP